MDESDERQVLTGNRAGRSGFARRYARGLSLSADIVRGLAGRADGAAATLPPVVTDPLAVRESRELGVKVYYHVIRGTRTGCDDGDMTDGVLNAISGMRSLFVVDADGWPVWTAPIDVPCAAAD